MSQEASQPPGMSLKTWNAAPWTRIIRQSEFQFRIAFYDLANKVAVDAGTDINSVAKFWLLRAQEHPEYIAERANPTEYKV